MQTETSERRKILFQANIKILFQDNLVSSKEKHCLWLECTQNAFLGF